MLLARFGLSAADVDEVEIAGGFGAHLNEASLTGIGLLPEEFSGRVSYAGNTSLSGAAAFLLNTAFRAGMIELVKQVETIDLAARKDFQDNFVKCLDF
jgi:uncharacterized 2Fe-2S/4Fe-4S cluster protein (DUF4445 family)